MNHIPGPWEPACYKGKHIVYYRGRGYVAICDSSNLSGDQHEANARLIAAAPDLLAACKAAEIWMKANYVGLIEWSDDARMVCAKIQDAIVLAKGESS